MVLVRKNLPTNAGDGRHAGLIPGSERSPGGRYGDPLQYSYTSLVAQTVRCLSTMWRPGFDPWVGKIPWRRKWQPPPVLLPGESHGQRSLANYSPQGGKESDTTERLHFHFKN